MLRPSRRLFHANRLLRDFNRQRPTEHYDNLELRFYANNPPTRAAIKDSYTRLAKHWHPDRNDDAEAGDQFAKISASYKVLNDEETKLKYDRWLQATLNPRGRADTADQDDPFSYRQYDDPERWRDLKAQEYARMRQSYSSQSN